MLSRGLSSGLKTKNRYYNLESFSPKKQEGSPTMKFVRLTLSKLVKPPIEIPGAAMATFFAWAAAAIWALSPAPTQAQTGPFSPSDWPPTINTSATVDYVIIDPNAVFTTPAGWNANLILAGGGDQTYSGITLNGLFGDQMTSDNLNIADPNYTMFANVPVIDILLQVYGNSSLYNADGSGKGVGILEGQLNYLTTPSAGTVPLGANNGVWNWMLLSVTNPVNPATGFRYVGDTSYPQQVNGQYGGVNGGTLRVQGIGVGLTVRAIALGPQGRVRNQQPSQCVHRRRHLRGGAAGQFDLR
jgi:hypothetical protein